MRRDGGHPTRGMIRHVPVDHHHELRAGVRALCKSYPDSYWRELDARREYPDAFVKALTDAGYLAALIPEEFGGSGLGVTEASIILEEVNRSGGNSGACHAQMYTMGMTGARVAAAAIDLLKDDRRLGDPQP